jgi:hypothetical protein
MVLYSFECFAARCVELAAEHISNKTHVNCESSSSISRCFADF